MVRNVKNGSRGNGALARLKADRKKSVIAACLIGVMVLMWVRVLLRKGPESAAAVSPAGLPNVSMSASKLEMQVSYVELPRVESRNDVLSRDFFASNDWAGFGLSGGNGGNVTEVNVDSKEDSQAVRRVASRLKLQVIWSAADRQAFINEKPFSVGDKFVLKEGSKAYEFEVSEISDKQVLIRCGEAKITLSLSAAMSADD
jgi:hypothetical protein